MTIPLDNLYDYIFSLTGHTNKNLIMYRFDPHGSKNIRNLIIHNNFEYIRLELPTTKEKRNSAHHKLLMCYDQEPLNFDLYKNDFESRKKIFAEWEGEVHQCNNRIGQKIIMRKNLCAHPTVSLSIYDKVILLHSEKNSKDLKKYEKNGFIGAYYWFHAFVALDWYRFARHDTTLQYQKYKKFDKTFNIYCRAWTGTREYRLKFLSYLNKFNIDKDSNIFLNKYDSGTKFYDYMAHKDRWVIDENQKEQISNLNCIKKQESHSALSAVYNSNDYQQSAIDVVLETVFDENKIQLTEKILRPIACGKPFLLISEKGSLEYLKSYGFKTFSNIIDESYDSISCPEKRLKAVIKTMKSISDCTRSDKNNLILEMHKIAEFNRKWFFSNEFFDIINNELIENLHHALNELDNPKYKTAKDMRTLYRSYRLYAKYLTGNERTEAERCISEYPERIELSKKNIGIS